MRFGLSAGWALAASALAVSAIAPASAQETDSETESESAFEGDHLTVGLGVGYAPSYDGSDDYQVFPAPALQGSLGGIGLNARSGGIALDFIESEGKAIDLDLGVAGRIRKNRTSHVGDPVVESAGLLDTAIEVGPSVGLGFSGVLNPYDKLSFALDVRWDVAGAHDGMVIDPTLSYFTPLSRGIAVNLSLSAEHGDAGMMDYYYSVTPAQSLASGLPAFDASGGGWTKAGATFLVAFDLDGELKNGGFILAVLGGYGRQLGDARRSPFTSVRGTPGQWLGGVGLGYTF